MGTDRPPIQDPETVRNGLTRRQAMARVGAAGAIAWATPILTSLNQKAFAASPGLAPIYTCSPMPPDGTCAGPFRTVTGGSAYELENNAGNGYLGCDANNPCQPGYNCLLVDANCGTGGQNWCAPACP